MKIKNEIFNKKLLCAAGVACALAVNGAYAAGNGCDNPDNDRINPEIALCSTHVYNIGGVKNPDSETNRQLMRDVVALKTTVMTQQMYKQYEYLETMIRRFKTQLEKAVLTTKIQVAGGGTSSSAGNSSYSGINISNNGSSSGNGRNNNTVLAGTTDCSMVAYADAFQCLISNIQLVINAASARTNMSEAKAQLEKDLAVALTWGIVCNKNGGKYSSCDTNSNSSSLSSCSTSVSVNNIVPCARQFNAVVSRAEWNMNNRQNQGQNRGS